MHLFYCPALEGEFVELPEEEAHHALSVLRMKRGDRIGLLNGRGLRAEAELLEVNKRACRAHILTRQPFEQERQARIHIAVAPTKQMERLEWFVEKAVELGVDRITPLLTKRTERTALRIDRLQRVAIAAMKQSQRTWLPVIDELVSTDALLAQDLPMHRYFGWCEGEHVSLMHAYDPSYDAIAVIGPEGDFDPQEATDLRVKGFTAVSLGHARLRTETAALAACAWMSLAQQR
ncbi:MAG: 16S rRNA (uracil(1498)-N(3))-methyltransferase [Flavobacteriales bacterium]|nr:16S rRNA (uracil(1498)-N(3))-methyltransferase [Flavobacteriales bacterium]